VGIEEVLPVKDREGAASRGVRCRGTADARGVRRKVIGGEIKVNRCDGKEVRRETDWKLPRRVGTKKHP